MLFAYAPAWHGAPVWDDDAHMTAPELRSAEGLRRIWFDVGATQQYYPLVHSAFWVMHRAWGDDPLGYHLVNILLHIASACLIALILRRLGVPGAALAAVVFAFHPVHVESVAWITQLKNALSGSLYFAAALAYLRFDERRERWFYWVSFGLFILALLSKTVTATLPAALLVVFWWKRGELSLRRDVAPLIPFFALGIAAGLGTAWVERVYIGAQGPEFQLSVVERVLVAGRALWFYAAKLAWPAGLTFIYPRWDVDGGDVRQYLYPLAAVATFVALWLLRRRSRAPLAAALLFAGTLFPALGFIDVFPFRYSFVADHFQYLATVPLIALFSAGVARLISRWPRRAEAAAMLALALPLAALTRDHSRDFADRETLYRETLDRNPACWLCHNNLAAMRLTESPVRLDAALRHLEHSLSINPRSAEAQNNLGFALRLQGRYAEAVRAHEEALRLSPGFAGAHNNLGIALQALGRPHEALEHYERSLRLDPRLPEAYHNVGRVLQELGRPADAVPYIETALRLRPDYADAYDNLGNAMLRLERIDAAMDAYRSALRIRPDDDAIRRKIAGISAQRGERLLDAERPADAIPHFEAALEHADLIDAAQVHNNLGIALAMTGHRDRAIEHFNQALRIRPDFPEARANLARAMR